MDLRRSYTLIAPIYDLALAAATRPARMRSLSALAGLAPARVLLAGVGTGLDLPHLPSQHDYVGVDFTAAMLRRSLARAGRLRYRAVQSDAMRLPFAEASFEHAVMHLILAVVPDPQRCLAETLRVLRPGGELLIFDKFLRAGQRAPLRRALNPLARQVATRLDVVLEDLLGTCAGLRVLADEPALAGGWFRRVRLRAPG